MRQYAAQTLHEGPGLPGLGVPRQQDERPGAQRLVERAVLLEPGNVGRVRVVLEVLGRGDAHVVDADVVQPGQFARGVQGEGEQLFECGPLCLADRVADQVAQW